MMVMLSGLIWAKMEEVKNKERKKKEKKYFVMFWSFATKIGKCF